MSGAEPRFAIYFAPQPGSPQPGSPLAEFGAAWLGYDVATGEPAAQPALPGFSPERLRAITAEPRRYGFHATLKPPFFLAAGMQVDGLDAAVSALAETIAAFSAPRPRLSTLSGFWALTLSEPCAALNHLADCCVRELDEFRAPPSGAELARRRAAWLSPAQEALLLRWGYPYVFDEYRFHMTLTQRLDPVEGNMLARELAPLVEPFCWEGLAIDAIGLFRQESAERPFRLMRRYPLSG